MPFAASDTSFANQLMCYRSVSSTSVFIIYPIKAGVGYDIITS